MTRLSYGHKFHAQATLYDGERYASKKEARYAQELDLRVRAGEVLFYLRQVPFDLPGGVKYRCDFMEFWTDGSCHIIDVKGFKTPEYRMKKKLVEAQYPITIEEV